MRVTLKDIAQAAGVSVMTVSNVINGKSARVSVETVERVRRIIDERGYVPSASARSLAANRSRLVGLLVPAASEDSLAISPHNIAIIGQIERRLRKRGYHLLLRGVSDTAEIGEALRSWSLDGAVLLGFLDEEIAGLHRKVTGATPVLAIDSYAAGPLTTGVRSDDFTGARLAAAHLLSLGHRRIVFAGPSFTDVGVVHERFLGFRQAFEDAGLSTADCPVETLNTTHENGAALGRRWLGAHPDATAVFATADILAIGIIEGMLEAGIGVPDQVSVVGFDDLDISAYITPKLTTIAQDIVGKATHAVDRLLTLVEGGERPAGPLVLDVRLVTRNSTAPPAR
ncbi:LacI family DNA-binding transcriptional regulator [Lentzea flaviverrucosa]|uniref:LacI family transcriptional regulator n=1 Tax=Lentzea flaviverrucosa TaxID=200379 RepID=A0A1H9XE04_9PSEU|nr:LacI family DNA-binding transcriptional regulator [Lentzea flaviverrucosa]RDI21536.1 LacI family transcriptional regulator [Lentzea flaviverrucosa]SES44352.1 LacI family transcriptional regulator [Lentzea flaviverrucosa]